MSKKAGYSENWFAEWFGQDYLTVYGHRDTKDASDLINLISRHIDFSKTPNVLDVGCGNGRHCNLMAGKGANVTGIDLSDSLLSSARQNRIASDRPLLVKGDMRYLPFKRCFHLVTNLFTSFGYFSRDTENESVVWQMAQTLLPNGQIVIDYLNPAFVKRNLISESHRSEGGLDIHEERRIEGERVIKKINISGAGRQKVFYESVRLYDVRQLSSMMNDAGIRLDKTYGNYHGDSLSDSAPRQILIGHRL